MDSFTVFLATAPLVLLYLTINWPQFIALYFLGFVAAGSYIIFKNYGDKE